ncbi:ATP-binding cassette domain-containing protein [Basilea psittacipulmonis]|uniref:ATP-binding protein Uup n=1 Tax=Basilea psittacipulmonis DSM 24701 TaxID=1072685 RepID=A0A077DHI9_9BURK|nr:ATP-binding cassette domain-containing protein [Basilea psittacipulmonis]AIL33027.1 ABC transporter ATP-binding protein [Basilea psittacipulmonis DSM 24701]
MSTLITLNNVSLAFGHHPLLDHANLSISSMERIGLIGRNGAGKSSLLKILDKRIQVDDGEVIFSAGLHTLTVEQEPVLPENQTIYEVLSEGMQEQEDWSKGARAKTLIDQLRLDENALISGLSGGTKKRIALAKAFINQPELLLLDEPTNHLDLEGILWLEQMIQTFSGAVMVITHDRRFLDAITDRIIELDRGTLHSFPGNYTQWQERKMAWLEAEAQQNAKFDKFLAQEEVWIRKGIEARRTRNEGRVRRLEALRLERSQRRERIGNVSFMIDSGERSGKLVAELQHIFKSYGSKTIIQDYSTTIMRGDRIGIIGPNGVGKTTLIHIILGKIPPDQGKIRLGTNLNIAYFDQMRDQLDEHATLCEVINPGSEWVEIGNERKHIMSYLGDFLFSPARANSPVSSLSGGERARLLMARLFARPANVLVMDEPTNDLDIETLELLETLIQEYQGTVIIVSHDRTFLENVVTQSIVYQGQGVWKDFVGVDWDNVMAHLSEPTSSPTPAKPQTSTTHDRISRPKTKKLGQYEEKELAQIPEKITELENQQMALSEELSNPELYETPEGMETVTRIQHQIAEIEHNILKLMQRWEVLEARQQAD